MPDSRRRRYLTEGLVIVASILLALGLEAAWSARLEDEETRELLIAIRDDVEDSRAAITGQLEFSRDLEADTRALLDALADGRPASEAPLRSIGSIFTTKVFEPDNTSYLEARSSGRLSLIDDPGLRRALTRYQNRIDGINRLAGFIAEQYYGQLEPFLVERTVYSDLPAEAWRERIGIEESPHATDFEALAESRELWNLLTLRLELEIAWGSSLVRLLEQTDFLQETLSREIG